MDHQHRNLPRFVGLDHVEPRDSIGDPGAATDGVASLPGDSEPDVWPVGVLVEVR